MLPTLRRPSSLSCPPSQQNAKAHSPSSSSPQVHIPGSTSWLSGSDWPRGAKDRDKMEGERNGSTGGRSRSKSESKDRCVVSAEQAYAYACVCACMHVCLSFLSSLHSDIICLTACLSFDFLQSLVRLSFVCSKQQLQKY